MGIQNKIATNLLFPRLLYKVSVVTVIHLWSGEVRGCDYTGSNSRRKASSKISILLVMAFDDLAMLPATAGHGNRILEHDQKGTTLAAPI